MAAILTVCAANVLARVHHMPDYTGLVRMLSANVWRKKL